MRLDTALDGKPAGFLVATIATVLLTAVMAPFRQEIGLLNEGLVFLLLTLLISAVWGRDVGLYTAVLTNLALNFFFIEPVYEFTVQEPRNLAGLVIFLIVSVVGGALLSTARQAAAEARRRQAEAEVALRLSRAMSGQTEPEKALDVLCQEAVQSLAAVGAAVLTRSDGGWRVLSHAGGGPAARLPDPEERAAVQRAETEGAVQSLGFSRLRRTRHPRIVIPRGRESAFNLERSVAFAPLKLADRVIGVLRVDGPLGDSPFRSEPESLLTALASEAALAVQRAELAREAAHAAALREADEMKTALMASISHDLKTPLASIKAAVSSLLDESVSWSPEDIDAFNRTIDSQADRLSRVISDILDLNRIESGSVQPDQEPVSALELLGRARDLTLLESKGREITIDAPASLRALTDESLIRQALVNLIENAIKYSRPGGAIHLSAEREAGNAVFRVKDEGPGIAEGDLPYVFERFYRAEEHSGRVKGSGLGLTIVRAFVELCGGEIEVDSSPAGTNFSIRLPAAQGLEVPA
jgi:two-component system sensor histidine kinase KdpD